PPSTSRSTCRDPLCVLSLPAATHISTLSLHAALPISHAPPQSTVATPATTPARSDPMRATPVPASKRLARPMTPDARSSAWPERSEEHTSELQSRENLVCRLLLEKKKKKEHHRHNTAD